MFDLLDKIRAPNALKALVGFKVVALAIIWVMMERGLYIGDRPLIAADSPATESKDQMQTADQSSDNEPTRTSENAAKPTKPRKSFLANLLELPPLEPDSIKKDELGRYLEIAERKTRQIEERLQILKNRESQLKGLEKSIEDKLRRLDEERRFFAQTIQQEKDLKGERLTKLITMYSKMEPKKAAPVIEKLDKDLVVELFKAMPQKQVTAILENMNPDKSVAVSEYYGRVRSAREYDLLKEMNQSLLKEFEDCRGMPSTSKTSSPSATSIASDAAQ